VNGWLGSVLTTSAAKDSAIVRVNEAFTKVIANRSKRMIEKSSALLRGRATEKATLAAPHRRMRERRSLEGRTLNYDSNNGRRRIPNLSVFLTCRVIFQRFDFQEQTS